MIAFAITFKVVNVARTNIVFRFFDKVLSQWDGSFAVYKFVQS